GVPPPRNDDRPRLARLRVDRAEVRPGVLRAPRPPRGRGQSPAGDRALPPDPRRLSPPARTRGAHSPSPPFAVRPAAPGGPPGVTDATGPASRRRSCTRRKAHGPATRELRPRRPRRERRQGRRRDRAVAPRRGDGAPRGPAARPGGGRGSPRGR